MPPQDRLRLEQQEDVLQPGAWAGSQARQRGGEHGQGERLPARQAWRPRALALQKADLVPQEQDLHVLVAVGATGRGEQSDEAPQEMAEDNPEPSDARGGDGW